MYIPHNTPGSVRSSNSSSLVQDVAQKMNEMASNGTTTTTVLASTIYAESVKNVAAGPWTSTVAPKPSSTTLSTSS